MTQGCVTKMGHMLSTLDMRFELSLRACGDWVTQETAMWPSSPTACVHAFSGTEKRQASLLYCTELNPVLLPLVCRIHIPVEA